MAIYSIIHYTSADHIGKTVHKTDTFNKTDLQSKFDALVKQLKPGESAEYMKEDNKRFYPSLAYVENENGKLYSYTHTGHKKLSKYN